MIEKLTICIAQLIGMITGLALGGMYILFEFHIIDMLLEITLTVIVYLFVIDISADAVDWFSTRFTLLLYAVKSPRIAATLNHLKDSLIH